MFGCAGQNILGGKILNFLCNKKWSVDQNVHSTAQSPANGIMGTHPIQAPCSVVDTYCKDIAEDTYKAHGGALTTLDFGVGAPPF